MSNKDLRSIAHIFREDNADDIWWFETPQGIEIHVDWVVNTDIHLIPWKTIRNALKRKDKK